MGSESQDFKRRLGERIRELRRRGGLTQEELAVRSGISQKYLSELERGAKAPAFDTLIELAHRGLRIQLSALVFAIDEPAPAEFTRLEDVLAGRPEDARRRILEAVSLLLEAGRVSP